MENYELTVRVMNNGEFIKFTHPTVKVSKDTPEPSLVQVIEKKVEPMMKAYYKHLGGIITCRLQSWCKVEY